MSDGYEIEELTRIEAALDDLVSPTSEDVFQATRPFDERAIASVAAKLAGEGGGGGAQPSVSDILVISANAPTLDSGSSWFWTSVAEDWSVQAQRGTDLSVVDEGGVAALHSVEGGDFVMHAHFNAFVVTLDGGSTLQRYAVAFSDFSPNSGSFSLQGFDALVPLNDGGSLDQAVSQPWFNVPADDLVTDLLLAVGCKNAAGADSIHLAVALTIWKLGPLPT